jgi:methyl-accepting chemotaxis protein
MIASGRFHSGGERWTVLAIQSRASIVAPVEALHRKTFGLAFTTWILLLGVGSLIASRIANPLQRYVSLVTREADRIAISSQEQSVATTQQANSIRETTATVRELKASMDQTQEVASTVVITAEASIRATAEGIEASTSARDAMNKLTERVNDVTSTISALSREMGRISEILSVVNDLAEQSKFLALNAAIEAARAGEHGKGFGVVSVEVRNLAQQSQEATNQIRLIIEETAQAMEVALHTAKQGQEEAHRGQIVVDRTKQVIDSLSEVIKDAKLSSDQILASINQQSLGIDQIASAIDQIDEGVNQTVTAAENTASISISLRDASDQLGNVVGRTRSSEDFS